MGTMSTNHLSKPGSRWSCVSTICREHSVILTSHREPLYSTGERPFTLRREEPPMGAAEVISFEEVHARKQWDALRHRLHDRFDQWLDSLEAQLQEPVPTLAQVTETVWN